MDICSRLRLASRYHSFRPRSWILLYHRQSHSYQSKCSIWCKSPDTEKRTIFSILFSKDKILPQNRTEYSHYDVGSELNQSMSRSDGNLLRVVSGGNTFQNCCTLENGNNRLSFPFEYITKLAFVDDKSKLQNTIITVL